MTHVTPTENDFTASTLERMPTLAVGQCCSLKIDSYPLRVWLCRMGRGVTIETHNPVSGEWEAKGGCL